MFAHELDWLTAAVRWLHVITGILWIGTSFHLFSWEYKFNRGDDLRPEVEGSLWMIQGGDFYHIERLRQEPERLPDQLVWFKYEAYFTWLSGFILLVLSYYFNARGMLVDPSVSGISPYLAIVISLISMPVCWFIYQAYCKTPIAENLPLSAAAGFIAVSLLAFFFSNLFGGRAAFLHLGIVMGTIMTANVFFVIIPWHKSLINAMKEQRPLDALYERHPGIRSDHNHYLALPVVFVMLSGHLPVAHSHPSGWIVISLCILAAGFLKHAHTALLSKRAPVGIVFLAAGVALLTAAIVLTRPNDADPGCSEPVEFARVRNILDTHCVSCHSATPSDPSLHQPPNNITFETIDEIDEMRLRILYRAVITRTMPPQYTTHMQHEERQLLGCWLRRGEEATQP